MNTVIQTLSNGDFKASIIAAKTVSGSVLYGAKIYYKDFHFRSIFIGDLPKTQTIARANQIITTTEAVKQNGFLFLNSPGFHLSVPL